MEGCRLRVTWNLKVGPVQLVMSTSVFLKRVLLRFPVYVRTR